MLTRVMLFLLFLGGVGMVIAGITVSVDATSYSLDESIRWPYTITGWILMGLGVIISLIATMLSIIVALWNNRRQPHP